MFIGSAALSKHCRSLCANPVPAGESRKLAGTDKVCVCAVVWHALSVCPARSARAPTHVLSRAPHRSWAAQAGCCCLP
jgi:hypothetical protein